MSTGSAAIPLLKAAPEPGQIGDRLEGGPWRGIELCLAGRHVADEGALMRAIDATTESLADRGMAVTAEAPVTWPSGAFVRVDRLDEEARAGIERSARFAAAIGSPVLTIHLFVPVSAAEFRTADPPDESEVERFLRFYAEACLTRGVKPLIENTPSVLRMRVGGFYLSRIGGHWRDLRDWRERVPELGFTLDTSHAALFRTFAAAYPTPFGLRSEDGLELERYVEELGPSAEVAHVSDAAGLLGEGLPYGTGELDLDPIVGRLAQMVAFIVAEINEPEPSASPAMKAGYRAIERAMAGAAQRSPAPRSRPPDEGFDWQAVIGQRDPIPAVIELAELLEGGRVLITGGGGSIGRALATLLIGFRPDRITLVDAHEGSLTADRRSRDATSLQRVEHVLCDIRERDLLERRLREAAPKLVFHLAAYKHVDLGEKFPDEFVDTNLIGTWNVLQSAAAWGAERVVVASTDKAALAASFYGRTKRLMEQLTAFAGRRHGSQNIAVRFVNVLGSAGSASELFLRQARAGVPMTVTDTGMMRYWITMAHATTLALHGALLAGRGIPLGGPSDLPMLTVGELAQRIWRSAGPGGEMAIEEIGIRAGETQSEVLTGPGEELGAEAEQGISPIEGQMSLEAAEWVAERLPRTGDRDELRAVWLEAMDQPGLIVPPGA
jgi:nucleoside-diphosphate-sugar epimerase/sugar phosphate isomerase/epimerase